MQHDQTAETWLDNKWSSVKSVCSTESTLNSHYPQIVMITILGLVMPRFKKEAPTRQKHINSFKVKKSKRKTHSSNLQ